MTGTWTRAVIAGVGSLALTTGCITLDRQSTDSGSIADVTADAPGDSSGGDAAPDAPGDAAPDAPDGGPDVSVDTSDGGPTCEDCPSDDECGTWACNPATGKCEVTQLLPDGALCGAQTGAPPRPCQGDGGQSYCQAGQCVYPTTRGVPIECSNDSMCGGSTQCVTRTCNLDLCGCEAEPTYAEGCCAPGDEDGVGCSDPCTWCNPETFACEPNGEECFECTLNEDCTDGPPCTTPICDAGQCIYYDTGCTGGDFQCTSAGALPPNEVPFAQPGTVIKMVGHASPGAYELVCQNVGPCPQGGSGEQCTSAVHLNGSGGSVPVLPIDSDFDWTCGQGCGQTMCGPPIHGTQYWMQGPVGEAQSGGAAGSAIVLGVQDWCLAISAQGLIGDYTAEISLEGTNDAIDTVVEATIVQAFDGTGLELTLMGLPYTATSNLVLDPVSGVVTANFVFNTTGFPVTTVAAGSMPLTSYHNTLSGAFTSLSGAYLQGTLVLTKQPKADWGGGGVQPPGSGGGG